MLQFLIKCFWYILYEVSPLDQFPQLSGNKSDTGVCH